MSEREPAAAAWMFPAALLLVVAVYTLPLAGAVPTPNPNEVSRLELAAALATRGHVHIDEILEVWPRTQDTATRGGRTYSDKAPGLSLLAVPVVGASGLAGSDRPGGLPEYWGLRHLSTWLLVALPGALLPFVLLRRYPRIEPASRVPVALIFAVATPWLVYSTLFFSHVPAGALAAVAWLLVLRPGRSDTNPSAATATLAGALSGFAVGVEYPTGLIAIVMLATLALRGVGLRVLVGFCAGGLIGALPALVYHQLAFGAVWATGYSFKTDAAHAAMHARGFFGIGLPSLGSVWGVLLGAQRGLLYYCPLFLLVPVGLALMQRERARDAWPLVAVSVLYVLFATGFEDWPGGWTPAARHLVPVTLLWIWPLAHALERVSRDVLLGLVTAGLAAFSLCGALGSIALTPYFPLVFEAPLAQLVLPSLLDGAALRNLFSELTGLAEPLGLGLLAAAAAVGVGLSLERLARSAARLWSPVVFAAAAVLYGLLLIATAPQQRAGHEVMRSDVLRRLGYEARAQAVERQPDLQAPAPR